MIAFALALTGLAIVIALSSIASALRAVVLAINELRRELSYQANLVLAGVGTSGLTDLISIAAFEARERRRGRASTKKFHRNYVSAPVGVVHDVDAQQLCGTKLPEDTASHLLENVTCKKCRELIESSRIAPNDRLTHWMNRGTLMCSAGSRNLITKWTIRKDDVTCPDCREVFDAVHFVADEAFRAACGADEPNQKTSTIFDNVTCTSCSDAVTEASSRVGVVHLRNIGEFTSIHAVLCGGDRPGVVPLTTNERAKTSRAPSAFR